MPKDGVGCPNFQWRFWVEQDRSRNISPIQSEKLGTEMPVKIVLVNLFYCDREHLIELPFNWYLITVWNSKIFSVTRLNYILGGLFCYATSYSGKKVRVSKFTVCNEVNIGNFTHPPTSAKTVLNVSKKLPFSEFTHPVLC